LSTKDIFFHFLSVVFFLYSIHSFACMIIGDMGCPKLPKIHLIDLNGCLPLYMPATPTPPPPTQKKKKEKMEGKKKKKRRQEAFCLQPNWGAYA
jgi:hypothetical protein